jgi:hypothetical protein
MEAPAGEALSSIFMGACYFAQGAGAFQGKPIRKFTAFQGCAQRYYGSKADMNRTSCVGDHKGHREALTSVL